MEAEDNLSSTSDNKPINNSIPLEQEWVPFLVLAIISSEYSSLSQFHKFYHLNAQFLQSPKQTTFSTNHQGIFKVVKISPPPEKARFFQSTKLEESSAQEDFKTSQVELPLVSFPQKSDIPCK
jgi:hypothetical protein